MGARTPTVVARGRDGSAALDGVRDSRLHDARCTRVVSHHVADARGGDGVGAVEGHSVAVATIVTAKLSSVASADELFMPILLLAIAALLSGLVGTILTAMSIADPLRQLRWAHGEVQRGNYNTHMKIYDASMLGLLQAGFNDMVRELSERQRLRDLFGRYVGEDVARRALESSPELGGQERNVAVLFVDLVGSTQLAATRPSAEIVGLLNEFFRIVVETVNRHGGFVDKFQGDAALAIFGCPRYGRSSTTA